VKSCVPVTSRLDTAQRSATGTELVGRAVEIRRNAGLKVVADADSRRILGAAILGTGGDEAIHGILDMMSADPAFRDVSLGRADPSHRIGIDPYEAARPVGTSWPRTRLRAPRHGDSDRRD